MTKIELMKHHNFDVLDMSRIIKCLELGGEIVAINDKPWAEINKKFIMIMDYLTRLIGVKK